MRENIDLFCVCEKKEEDFQAIKIYFIYIS